MKAKGKIKVRKHHLYPTYRMQLDNNGKNLLLEKNSYYDFYVGSIFGVLFKYE